MRVADGGERAEDAMFNPQVELTYTKGSEMFAESIPSAVLQTYAVLQARMVERAAVFSLLSSAAAIAFASSTISMDFDINPINRLNYPSFYVSSINHHKH